MRRTLRRSMLAAAVLVTMAASQDPKHGMGACSYSVTHNGPTWDANVMTVSYGVMANAWARDGAYGGGGASVAFGFSSGGAAVAVASTSFWFKVSHHAVAGCRPVKFDSDATLKAEVSTKIHGDTDDYALATGFQAIGGNALRNASVAVAATNAGSPVQQSTIGVTLGTVGFSLTIPGVSVTTDTVDTDRNSIYTSGAMVIEEEQITVHCWTKTKVVTNGPFGGFAHSSVDATAVTASTSSTCPIHGTTGYFAHEASEG